MTLPQLGRQQKYIDIGVSTQSADQHKSRGRVVVAYFVDTYEF
jgi:hypothetical protein